MTGIIGITRCAAACMAWLLPRTSPPPPFLPASHLVALRAVPVAERHYTAAKSTQHLQRKSVASMSSPTARVGSPSPHRKEEEAPSRARRSSRSDDEDERKNRRQDSDDDYDRRDRRNHRRRNRSPSPDRRDYRDRDRDRDRERERDREEGRRRDDEHSRNYRSQPDRDPRRSVAC
jgi:hypothetical protein